MPRRGGTSQRGYGSAHVQARRRLLPAAYGQPCPQCGRVMLRGQALDLDHAIPLVLGGAEGPKRIVHAFCNRSAGSKLRHRLDRARRASSLSRSW